MEMVGEGGMGSVYKAIDTQANDRLVAIKEMCLDHYHSHGKQNAAQKLFRQEARILSNLSHPNLPRVYAFFNEDGRSYLVMDFIEGKTTVVKDNRSYDVIIVYAAQFSSWMTHHVRQLGFLCIWLTSTIARQVANAYGLFCTWLLPTILLRLKQPYRIGISVRPAWTTEFWQSFSTTEARSLIQDVWTPYFTFLFVLLATAMTSGSMYMLTVLHYPIHLVAFYLCLLLLLLLSIVYTNLLVRHPLTHSIFMAMTLFLLFIGIALFASPEVQPIIRTTTFNQLLTVGIILLVTVSLLRPTQRFAWVDNLCLAVIAATYALLSSNMGAQALHQLLLIPMNNARLVNLALVSALCLVALTQLVHRKHLFIRSGRSWNHRLPLVHHKHPFTRSGRPWSHRLPLFIVALSATILQLAYGLQEITHLPLFMFYVQQTTEQSLNLATFNVLLAGVPVVTALLRLFIAQGSSHLRRLLLLLLGLSCAALQNFLGPIVQFSLLKAPLYPLDTSLTSIMHINQLAAYSLALIAYILLCRWQRPFGWFDQFSLFCVVIVCAFLQSTACNYNGVSQSTQGIPIQQSQLYMIVINQLLAQVLMLIALVILTITISRIFLHLASDFTWVDRQITRVNRRFMWLDRFALPFNHFILLITSITNILLLWLHSSSILQVTSIQSFTRSQLIIAFLLICSLATLIRILHPFSSIDRWLILMNVITCALLLFTGYTQQTIMQDHFKITSVKPWLADPHIMFPLQSIAFGLLFATLVSLIWVRRRVPQTHRSMLKVMFGLTLVCAALQWLTPAFLLAGLIMLTLSILLAIQVEQA